MQTLKNKEIQDYENMKRTAEFYFRKYYTQAEEINKTIELIKALVQLKQEIQADYSTTKGMTYDSIRTSGGSTSDPVLDAIIKKEEKIQNVDLKINNMVEKLEKNQAAYNIIDSLLPSLTTKQLEVFELLYRDNLSFKAINYSDRHITNTKNVIIKKFIDSGILNIKK